MGPQGHETPWWSETAPTIKRVIKGGHGFVHNCTESLTHAIKLANVVSTQADGIKIQIYFHINSYEMILQISPGIHQTSYF